MKKTLFKRTVQLFFFLLVGLIVLNHNLEEAGKTILWIPSVSLHAICPFGAVETIYSVIMFDLYISKIHSSTLVLFTIILSSSLLFGPLFCGYICPLGSIQEWISQLGKKIFKQKFNTFVPKRLDNLLKHLRFAVLLWVFYMSAKTLSLVFLAVDPFHALFNFYTSEVALGGLIVLGFTLIGSLFIERPWCKYLCPYGALLGLTNKFRIFTIKRNEKTCIDCKICDKVCPMNIEVSKKKVISDLQCISCHECLSEVSCPMKNTLTISLNKRKDVSDE